MKGRRQWSSALPVFCPSSSRSFSSSRHTTGRIASSPSRVLPFSVSALSFYSARCTASPGARGKRCFPTSAVTSAGGEGLNAGRLSAELCQLRAFFSWAPSSLTSALSSSFSCIYNPEPESPCLWFSSSRTLSSSSFSTCPPQSAFFSSSRGAGSSSSFSSSTSSPSQSRLSVEPRCTTSTSFSLSCFSSVASLQFLRSGRAGVSEGRRGPREKAEGAEEERRGACVIEKTGRIETKREKKEAREPSSNQSSCSSQRPWLSDEEYVMRLEQELQAIDAAKLLPDRMQFLHKQRLLAILGPLLKDHIGGSLIPFGSCANGFWIRGSDIDSCLVLPGCEGRALQRTKLRVVKEVIERHGIGKATVVPAQVPIAKVYNAEGEGLVDVSVNNCAALENSVLIQTFGEIDSRVRPLGRFIKYWAKQRKINNRSEGTLSTYTLMLQLIFFLQTRNPPILPSYQSMELRSSTAAAVAGVSCSSSRTSSAASSSPPPPPPRSSVPEPQGLPSTSSFSSSTQRNATALSSACANEGAIGSSHTEREGGGAWGSGVVEKSAPVVTPAEGLRPLPFSTDTQRIRRELIEKYGENEESLGQLIRDFFLFYGSTHKTSMLGPRDGALVVMEVYDASASIHTAKYTSPTDSTTTVAHFRASCPCPSSSASSSPSSSSRVSDTRALPCPASSSSYEAPPAVVSKPSSSATSGTSGSVSLSPGEEAAPQEVTEDDARSRGVSSQGEAEARRKNPVASPGPEFERRADEETRSSWDEEVEDDRNDFAFFNKNRRLVMKCPLTRQVVNRFSSGAWEVICKEFQRAEGILRHQQGSLEAICVPAPLSHLQTKKLGRLQRRNMIRELALSRGLLALPSNSRQEQLEGGEGGGVKKTAGRESMSLPGSVAKHQNRVSVSDAASYSDSNEEGLLRHRPSINPSTIAASADTATTMASPLPSPAPQARRVALLYGPYPGRRRPSPTDVVQHNIPHSDSCQQQFHSPDKGWTEEPEKEKGGRRRPSSEPHSPGIAFSPPAYLSPPLVCQPKTEFPHNAGPSFPMSTQTPSLLLAQGVADLSRATVSPTTSQWVPRKKTAKREDKKRFRSVTSSPDDGNTRGIPSKNPIVIWSSSSAPSSPTRGHSFHPRQSRRNRDDARLNRSLPGCHGRRSVDGHSPELGEEDQPHPRRRVVKSRTHNVEGSTWSTNRSVPVCSQTLERDYVVSPDSTRPARTKEQDNVDDDVDILLRKLQLAQSTLRTRLEEHLHLLKCQLKLPPNSTLTARASTSAAR